MNQTIIVIASIVSFIVITSVFILIYSQNQNNESIVTVDCSFSTNSLLNYLRNPQCSRPRGVELHDIYDCVTYFDQGEYQKVQCIDSNKAWIQDGCLYVNLGENNTLAKCT